MSEKKTTPVEEKKTEKVPKSEIEGKKDSVSESEYSEEEGYEPDPSISKDSPRHYTKQQSQPCSNIRGVSYTPPGWQRRRAKKSKGESDIGDSEAKKKLKYN